VKYTVIRQRRIFPSCWRKRGLAKKSWLPKEMSPWPNWWPSGPRARSAFPVVWPGRSLIDAEILFWWYSGDPFDRLLVAQAQDMGTPIVSGDRLLDRYDIKRLW